MAENSADTVSPLVVKVGGSLAETGRMPAALSLIAAARVPVVVVPGGGPFADSIRALQPTMKFGEALAHRLAMLAMHQMAELIVVQNDRFSVVQSLAEISDAVRDGKVPVWAPLRMIAGDAAVPAGWTATSDTLAARLAELLGAPLVLLKSVDVEEGASLDDLAACGVVDPVMPSVVARGSLSWSIFGPSDDALFRALLAGEGER
ncbi:MAG: uridylate kinase [Hyphomicrobium denitrificans]|nr:uridylate kinase [Hyphomicrobium denitrificans]